MTHTDGIVRNDWGKLTRILWSRNPTGKAVVFVHGFPGDYTTWDGFPSMILQESQLSGHDIFFVEYEGADRAVQTASVLKHFFNALFQDPEHIFASELRRIGRKAFNYEDVIIAAHSFGVVVTRVALLDALDEGLPWVEKTKSFFFAPAHLGANIIGLGKDALGFFGQFAESTAEALKEKYPVLIDMEQGSATLQMLRDRTQQFIDAGAGEFTIACDVLLGTADRIVVRGQFCSDPPAIIFPSIGHKEICNPSAAFPEPFTVLVSRLTKVKIYGKQ